VYKLFLTFSGFSRKLHLLLEKGNQLINKKFKKFYQYINFEDFLNLRTLLIVTSWLLTVSFLLYSLDVQPDWAIVWLLIAAYFWVHTNRILLTGLKPPTELILIVLFIFTSLDIIVVSNYLNENKTFIIGFLHRLILTLDLLLIGLLLISNSQKKSENYKIQQRVLIWYSLIGYLAHHIAFYDHIYYLYGFQVILFLVLLKKSIWLESLSKSQLWISFLFILFLFFVLPGDSKLHNLSVKQITPNAYWISIPYYLYLIFKMYLLATLVKIPVVMIYNHATLSKKLSIAGLFQSSFPQFIQSIVLLSTFYFFIASWQGDQLRTIIISKIQSIITNKNPDDLTFFRFEKEPDSIQISINGYQDTNIKSDYNKISIVALNKSEENTKISKDYFFYINPKDTISNNIFLLKIDTTFIKEITHELSVVVSSGIKAYPFELKEWKKTLYEIDYWQKNEKIKIFPFSLFSNNFGNTIETEIWSYDEPDSPKNINSNIFVKINRNLVLGRLYFKTLNLNDENAYFAIDIYFAPDSSFFTSFIAKIILVLIILSFLFNAFVTKRVIKFGEEIRTIIIRKFTTLKTGIKEISSGNLDYKVKLEGEDEFVEFANHFNEMGKRLQQTMADQRKMDRLNHEFQIARNVQLGLLPTKLPQISGYKISASFETAIEVGGDFYDILQLDKYKYLFTIGDVSGKGASAAFYMAQFTSLLRYSVQFTKKPEDIADRLNKYFISHVTDKQIFITAIIGILDIEINTISIIRAGHNLPIYIPGDEKQKVNEINIQGIGIGLSKTNFKKSLKVHNLNMNSGDKLLLITDGIPEAARPALNDNMEIYGEEHFLKLINESRNFSAKELSERINSDLIQFYGKYSRVDDHTTLIIEKI
jgi:serine phosphatase RsbU (regulator of sigma subunit)